MNNNLNLNLIDSLENPKIKRIKKLLDSSKFRRDQQATLLDGEHLIQSFFMSNQIPEAIFIKRSEYSKKITFLKQFNLNLDKIIYNISDKIFNELSSVEDSTGILAVIFYHSIDDFVFNPQEKTIVLDNIQDPGNLGAIIRTCGAFGVKNILLSKGCVDAWSPKVLRAGMGGHFCLNLVDRLDHHDIIDLIQSDPHNYLVATVLAPDAETLFEHQVDSNRNYIWLFGNEGNGISQDLLNAVHQPIYIPMENTPIIESLNVASSVAICLAMTKCKFSKLIS